MFLLQCSSYCGLVNRASRKECLLQKNSGVMMIKVDIRLLWWSPPNFASEKTFLLCISCFSYFFTFICWNENEIKWNLNCGKLDRCKIWLINPLFGQFNGILKRVIRWFFEMITLQNRKLEKASGFYYFCNGQLLNWWIIKKYLIKMF